MIKTNRGMKIEVMVALVINAFLFCPTETFGQTLSASIKRAGIISFWEEGANSLEGKGNVIYFRLNDKNRRNRVKHEILVHETCFENKRTREFTINVKDIEMDDIEIDALNLNGSGFIINVDSKGFFLSLHDKEMLTSTRLYKIGKVLFYESFDDIFTGNLLGEEETSSYAAFYYIKEMFRRFK